MVKTVEIPLEEWWADFKALIQKMRVWLDSFFRTITTYESIAVGAISLGFILVIIGFIIV